MRHIGYDLWYFDETAEYGESDASGFVMPLPPDVILYKSVYLSQHQATTEGLLRAQQVMQTLGNTTVLRPVHSSDGPPFRTVLPYVPSGNTKVQRLGHPRSLLASRTGAYTTDAIQFRAVRGSSGSSYAWVTETAQGTSGFFLTGSSGLSALWRVARIEVDALDRQVLTLAPVRLPHGIVAADFSAVADARVRQHLEQHFAAFQGAVAAGAHLDVIDRAYNLAEGVLEHCLTEAGRPVPATLHNRLAEARKVLDAKGSLGKMPLSEWGYTLAEKIRQLNRQVHADQVVARGQMVRPEVGMTLTADVSELLRDVGLGRY
jgi:hypothetical protein